MSTPFVLPQVHPQNWPGKSGASFKPIHSQMKPGPGTQQLPLVSWSYAAGPMAAFISSGWLEKNKKTVEEIHQESLRNLEAQPCKHQVVDLSQEGGEKVLLGMVELARSQNPHHIAAADHILNRRAMLALQQGLGAEPMVVAIPYAEVLFAANTSLVQSGAFLNLASKAPPEGSEALTSIVFLIQNGEVVGKVNYG